MIHPEFVSLADVCEKIVIVSSYSTTDNFTGTVVPGYKARKAYLARIPAVALARVQNTLLSQGLSLKVFDGYRPLKAVQYFQDWALQPETNPAKKQRFYPRFSRLELFEKGFIAKQSSHSRGCAVDLTLADIQKGQELDMGGEFDYFDEISFTASEKISEEQMKNRMLLKTVMESHGFRNFSQEWWHYSFKEEPFPGMFFDFDVV